MIEGRLILYLLVETGVDAFSPAQWEVTETRQNRKVAAVSLRLVCRRQLVRSL